MEEPDKTERRPSSENIQTAVDFFCAFVGLSDAEVRKENWKEHLQTLEDVYRQNAEGSSSKVRGLSSSQIESLIEAILSFVDQRHKIQADENVEKKKKRNFKLPATVFNLPKICSKRLIHCLVPAEPVSEQIVQRVVICITSNLKIFDENNFVLPFLRWTNCLLHYNLCPADALEAVYECFLHGCSSSKLVPILSDILFKLTNYKKLVTRSRCKYLLDIQNRCGKISSLANLLQKFKDLRPDVITKDLDPVRWSPAGDKGPLEVLFGQVWSNRDVLFEPKRGLGSKLEIWGAPGPTYVLADQRSTRKRLCVIPPVDQYAPLVKKERKESQLKSISQFKTVREMYENLHLMKLPREILSILGSRQTFVLLFMNKNPIQVQERFSLTLYKTLYYEFFSLSASQGYSKRKLDLLCRINSFQSWLQESIPVVERFLVEYLEVWNGKDYFVEILRLISLMRITDFEEFNDCILSKLRQHFNQKYSSLEQLLVLSNLKSLCLHWAWFEVPKVKGKMKYIMFGNSSRTHCENPLQSLCCLVHTVKNWAELGLTKLTYFSLTNMNQEQKQRNLNLFVSEVISMITQLARSLIHLNIPIKPELPPAFYYFSLFGLSACNLVWAVEFLAMTKHELIPLCKRRAEQFDREQDFHGKEVALAQVEKVDSLNIVTKDILATLSSSPVYLERGQSIFRKHWDLEDEEIRFHLNISSHPALFPVMIDFINKELKGTRQKDRSKVFLQLSDEESEMFHKYMSYLKDHFPILVDSLDTFEFRLKHVQHRRDEGSIADSSTTSGVSSVKPRPRLPRLKKN